jgi:hypothetical protein
VFPGCESVPTGMLYIALIQSGVMVDPQLSVASIPTTKLAKKPGSFKLIQHTWVPFDFSKHIGRY